MSLNQSAKIKLPKFASRDAGLAEALNLLARAIESIRVPDIRISGGTQEWRGDTVILRPEAVQRGGNTGVKGICRFGEIIPIDDETPFTRGIRGGIIHCGDKTWNFPYQGVNLIASGEWLVHINVTVEINRDDDNSIPLPGVKTGTKPTGDWSKTDWSKTEGADYPDGTIPTAITGAGMIVLPIGKLKVEDGVATLESAGCGHFTITHCAGELGYVRS